MTQCAAQNCFSTSLTWRLHIVLLWSTKMIWAYWILLTMSRAIGSVLPHRTPTNFVLFGGCKNIIIIKYCSSTHMLAFTSQIQRDNHWPTIQPRIMTTDDLWFDEWYITKATSTWNFFFLTSVFDCRQHGSRCSHSCRYRCRPIINVQNWLDPVVISSDTCIDNWIVSWCTTQESIRHNSDLLPPITNPLKNWTARIA